MPKCEEYKGSGLPLHRVNSSIVFLGFFLGVVAIAVAKFSGAGSSRLLVTCTSFLLKSEKNL